MKVLDDFRGRQTEISQMISDLRAIMTPEQLKIRPTAETAHKLLCDLGQKLKNHLSAEDKGVYPPLLTHEDPKLKSLAWGFISGQKPLRKQFESYHQRWLKDCNFEFTQDFMDATIELFDAIEMRIDRESTVLLPKLEQSGMFAARA
ncbi:MAG: hemerythrin domain-containing protein [Sedimenticola sp.]